MGRRLKALFDFQRFAGNLRLERLIAPVEAKYFHDGGTLLGEDELGQVAAAGDPFSADPEQEKNKKFQ